MNIANFLRTPVLKNFCVWLLLKKAMWIALSSGKISPAGNYMIKVNNRNTRTRCEICSKLTNMFKVNNATASFWYLYCKLWTYFNHVKHVRTSRVFLWILRNLLRPAFFVEQVWRLLLKWCLVTNSCHLSPRFFSLFSLILKC